MINEDKAGVLDIKSIVKDYHALVYRTCYSIIMNREDAEDITQEVFLTVHQLINSFNNNSKISTWLYRIAVNKSLNHIRKNKVVMVEYNQEHDFNYYIDISSNEILDKRKAMLKKALSELPEKQRTAFVMNKYNGFTAKEIAEIFECSLSSVEVSIHRAFKNISKKILEIYNNGHK
jgi:RNA polymerase sigma-70 factor (ECF subfamily)